MGSYFAIVGVEPWRKLKSHQLLIELASSRCRDADIVCNLPRIRAACKTAPPPPNRFIKTEILHRREAHVALESKVLVKRLCI
jgi:hypothetical protein